MKNRDLTGHLFCPHDLTHNSEFRDDLPTLLGSTIISTDEFKTTLKLSKRSALSVFDTPNSSDVSCIIKKDLGEAASQQLGHFAILSIYNPI